MSFVRPSWHEGFMLDAIRASMRSTCLLRRCGAVLVRDKRAIASGYNGAPPDVETCLDTGVCFYQGLAYQESQRTGRAFEHLKEEKKQFCNAAHAEKNAFNQCSDQGIAAHGATMYITNFPCPGCVRDDIIPNHINKIYIWKDYLANPLISMDEKDIALYWLKQKKIEVVKLDLPEYRVREITEGFLTAGDRLKEYRFDPGQLVRLSTKPNFT